MTKIWQPCNIYESAMIHEDVSIGVFTEVGHQVVIGRRTRIGAHCFIPEGVRIGEDCFIGPRVTFTNDKYPPSGRENWGYIIVEDGASIGAGSIILTGVRIGKKSLIGAGSVVTKNVPDGQVWMGNPAFHYCNIGDIDLVREEQAKGAVIADSNNR